MLIFYLCTCADVLPAVPFLKFVIPFLVDSESTIAHCT